MDRSIFTPLIQEGLTTLQIRYDWRTGQAKLYAAKEWEADTTWRHYNRAFYADSILTNQGRYLNDPEVRHLYAGYGLEEYLGEVLDLLRQGRHFGIDCFYYQKKDIRFISNMHSVIRGINNRSQAIRSGGIRRHDLTDPELEVIVDGLNLARAMSFKNVAAEIPYGGSKITVHANPVDLDDMDEIGFLSYALDRTRSFTGPDMGYPPELADVMKEHFTLNITGGPRGPLGPTGTPTAYGVYLAAKQGARFKYGTDSLKDRTIAVQGLGALGFPLAEHFLQEQARLIVTDINPACVRLLKEKHPEAEITAVEPQQIYYVEADIFAPAARGGIITADLIPALKFEIIMGGANNTLKASSQEEEYRLARLLHERGILYQCEWWHNVGGVLAGWEEYVNQDKADLKRILAKIKHLCTHNTWANLAKAAQQGITPTECAYRTVEEMIYGG